MKTPYVLAISSFAVHGTASLKTLITILGEKVLPVPSLLLNGLTNMSLVKKFDVPFRELLQSSFELAVNRELDVILYIGYLGNAGQATIILEMIVAFRANIKTIITDPVSGDHGKAYVPAEVVEQWPNLIRRSDLVFPNLTELKMLTGNKPDDHIDDETLISEFKLLFPQTRLIVTSIKTNDGSIGFQSHGDERFSYSHQLLPKNYGGSGDAFLALFILNYYYKELDFNEALQLAAEHTWLIIENSIAKGSNDLILTYPNKQLSK